MNATYDTIRIMLVDDHQTMLWGLERLIESEAPRMQVAATARSSEEALAKLEQAAPDVVLLDIDLGGQSGLDVLPALIEHKAQVLILTGAKDQQLLYTAVRIGARGVVCKDVPAGQLLKAIEKVHGGELWVDQAILGCLVRELVRPAAPAAADASGGREASLTARERKIIQTLVEVNGASNRTIADRLFISEHTLRKHLTSIYQKLGVGTRVELYAYATRHGVQVRTPDRHTESNMPH
jgi:DNA-binding NarL/FixJ family response regulator